MNEEGHEGGVFVTSPSTSSNFPKKSLSVGSIIQTPAIQSKLTVIIVLGRYLNQADVWFVSYLNVQTHDTLQIQIRANHCMWRFMWRFMFSWKTQTLKSSLWLLLKILGRRGYNWERPHVVCPLEDVEWMHFFKKSFTMPHVLVQIQSHVLPTWVWVTLFWLFKTYFHDRGIFI